jgi:hypothetical protein
MAEPTQVGNSKDFSSNQGTASPSGTPGWVTNTITNLMDTTVKFVDQEIQDTQKAGLRASKEAIDLDVRNSEREYQSQRAAIEALPAGVADKMSTLERLDNAYKSGALSESNYYSRLDAAAREMRSRYPGYKDEIDGFMSRLTGINPANAVAKDIIDRMSRTTKNPERELENTLNREARDKGITFTPGMSTKEKESIITRYNASEIEFKKHREVLDLNKSQLNYTTEQRKERDLAGQKAVNAKLNLEEETIFSAVVTDTSVKEYQRLTAEGGAIPPEIGNKMKVLATQVEMKMMAIGRKALNDLGDTITPEEATKIQRSYTDKAKSYSAMLYSGDLSVMNANKAQREADIQYGAFSLYLKEDIVRNTARASAALGDPRLLEIALAKANTGNLISGRTMLETSISNFLISGIVAGKPSNPSVGELKRMAESQSQSDKPPNAANTVSGTIKQIVTNIDNPKLPPEMRKAHLEWLTSTENSNFVGLYGTSESKEKAYALITDPKTVESVKDLNKKYPGTLEKHNNMVVLNGGIVINSYLDTVKDINSNAQSPSIIKYNADVAKFEMTANPAFKRTPTFGSVTNTDVQLSSIMDKLNINLERMSMGLVPSNEMAPKIEDINRIVAGTNFKFEPMKKPETVVKPFQDKAPT